MLPLIGNSSSNYVHESCILNLLKGHKINTYSISVVTRAILPSKTPSDTLTSNRINLQVLLRDAIPNYILLDGAKVDGQLKNNKDDIFFFISTSLCFYNFPLSLSLILSLPFPLTSFL